MFLLDDILMIPARGFMAMLREVHNAAQEESASEAAEVRFELSELYLLLERQQVSEAEFDRRENELLDRLEQLDAREYQENDDYEPEMDEVDELDEADNRGDSPDDLAV